MCNLNATHESQDRMLLEYDLVTSSFDNGLLLLGARSRVEQTALPRTMVWHPDTEAESFLLMVCGGREKGERQRRGRASERRKRQNGRRDYANM